MNKIIHKLKSPIGVCICVGLLIIVVFFTIFIGVINKNNNTTNQKDGRLVTIYDRDTKKVVLTKAKTIGDVLKEAKIDITKNDIVEPSTDEELVASEYQVNIYRARPVMIIDGNERIKIVTAYQTASQIAAVAGIKLYDEDEADLNLSDVIDGAGLQLKITRAVAFSFDQYGKTSISRTQAKTVGDMLKEKGITLGKNDKVTPGVDTAITSGMSVRVWREGRQTITIEEEINYDSQTIEDANRDVTYHDIRTAGVKGTQDVTYEVLVENGVEISRTKIASVVTRQPITEIKVVGAKASGDGLSKNKGVNYFTDSSGVTHRETYYDLYMGTVISYCGGSYSIRSDGAKVDQNGYVLVAANLSRYPRCSVVETSLGLGKVYDTGGFVSTYPNGFDLATDWSNYDGR